MSTCNPTTTVKTRIAAACVAFAATLITLVFINGLTAYYAVGSMVGYGAKWLA